MSSRVAVVTGANQGIGFAIVKKLVTTPNLIVILTARDEKKGQEAVNEIKKEFATNNLESHQLDITDKASIDRLAAHLKQQYGGLDILVNNAAIAFKGDAFDSHVVETTLKTNYFGTVDICEKLIPLIKPNGRVVNVSSTAGRLGIVSEELQAKFSDPNASVEGITKLMNKFAADVADGKHHERGWPQTAYGVSKVGVTALTKALARSESAKGRNILINCCCPGWVRTSMAGPKAPLTPEQGAETPVLLAVGDIGDKTGLFWKDKQVQKW